MTIRSGVLAVGAAASLALSGLLYQHVSAAPARVNHAHSAARLALVHPGYLSVGSDTTYPPMESLNPQTHAAVGADIDLAAAMAGVLHLKGARIVSNDFNTIIPALERGNFDIIMSSMNNTPARRKQIAFVNYLRASEGIVVHGSSPIKGNSYAALCGHSIAVESGTTEQDGLKAANQRCGGRIDVKVFTLDTAAFEAFASGHAEAYTGDLPVCALYVKSHSGLRLAGKPFGAGEDYGIGMLYRNKGLRAAIKHALQVIRRNGTYDRILKKWGVNGAKL